MLILREASILQSGIMQTQSNHLISIRLPTAETVFQFILRDMNIHIRIATGQDVILTSTDLSRPLNIYIHDHIFTLLQQGQDIGL